MQTVYLVAATRTPIGSYGGALASVPAAEMASACIKGVLETSGVEPASIDEVVLGHVLGAGQGMGPARQASLGAQLPVEVPAHSVNMICGSGLKAMMHAANQIRVGDADLVIAGGMENMSLAPYAVTGQIRHGVRLGNQTMVDTMMNDGLTDAFKQYPMGMTAENIANRYEISREQQDAFALQSQQRAVAAMQAGKFEAEITPIATQVRRKEVIVREDEYPKPEASLEGLAKLRPAFDKAGSVTAGNASGINDGAAVLMLASEAAIKAHGLKPIAKILSQAQAGVPPEVMGLGPVPAIQKLMQAAGKQLSEVDLIELNEAFAVQALGVIKDLKQAFDVTDEWISERTNVNGGAIALGHPIGASGARIVVTLLHEMQRQQKTLGLASLCVGGGMGVAMLIERCE